MMRNYSLNKVEDFNPYDFVEDSKNRRGEPILKKDGTPLQYLSTAAKLLWFRKVYPNGVVRVMPVDTEKQEFGTIVKYKAEIRLNVNDPLPVAEWQHQETVWDVAEMDAVVSKVETIVLGKALSKAGFGCEIELELGAVSEGEAPVETTVETEKPATEAQATPKKKRGRPKKETQEVPDTEKEVEDLLKSIEAQVSEEKEPELEPEKEPEEDKLKRALATKLVCTDKAPVNIRKFEGQTIEEVLNQYSSFCTLVKTRPNIRASISEECAEAAVYIADNM